MKKPGKEQIKGVGFDRLLFFCAAVVLAISFLDLAAPPAQGQEAFFVEETHLKLTGGKLTLSGGAVPSSVQISFNDGKVALAEWEIPLQVPASTLTQVELWVDLSRLGTRLPRRAYQMFYVQLRDERGTLHSFSGTVFYETADGLATSKPVDHILFFGAGRQIEQVDYCGRLVFPASGFADEAGIPPSTVCGLIIGIKTNAQAGESYQVDQIRLPAPVCFVPSEGETTEPPSAASETTLTTPSTSTTGLTEAPPVIPSASTIPKTAKTTKFVGSGDAGEAGWTDKTTLTVPTPTAPTTAMALQGRQTQMVSEVESTGKTEVSWMSSGPAEEMMLVSAPKAVVFQPQPRNNGGIYALAGVLALAAGGYLVYRGLRKIY